MQSNSRFSGNRFRGGFTLIELMITVAIIAILSAVAIPAYTDYITRGKLPEATNALASSRIQLEQYYQDNRTYSNAAGNCGVALPSGKDFTFACETAGQTYTITATGKSTSGLSAFVYTINESGNRQTTGLPEKWGTASASNPVSCWVTKKGGGC